MALALLRASVGLLIALAIPAVPTLYASQRLTSWRHFRVVEEGRLYRSGQLTPEVLDRVIHDHGIKTIICLRNLAREGDDRLENTEELWCSGRDVQYIRLHPESWDSPAGQANLDAFLNATDQAKDGPVLIHCFAGLHRTGVFCAVFRMEREGWSNEEAIAEMYRVGYFQEDPAALAFLKGYVRRSARRLVE